MRPGSGIARRSLGGAVTVVSHDAVNSQVLVTLGDPDALPQDNGCFSTLEWRGGWTVLSVNELPGDGEEIRPWRT